MNSSLMSVPEKFKFVTASLDEVLGEDFMQEIMQTEPDLKRSNGLMELKAQFSKVIGDLIMDGLLIRAGRAGFYYWMRQFSDELGWTDTDFRLMPVHAKTKRAVKDLVQWLHDSDGFTAEIVDSADYLQITVSSFSSANSIMECNYFSGLIQELYSWAGSGRFFEVHQVKCCARADPSCVFQVKKRSPD